MTHTHCDYSGSRDEVLVAYLYDDIEPAVRAVFDAHLTMCSTCRDELSALEGVRGRLGRWLPPERQSAVGSQQSAVGSRQSAVGSLKAPVIGRRSWWREVPAWAQVAAAFLFLGVAAGIANIDARYDSSGLSVKTGWSKRTDAAGAAVPARGVEIVAPWRSDLAALEERLRAELPRANAQATTIESAAARPNRPAAPLDAEALGRVRALIGESERRQQSELALRAAEIIREVNTQRQADLVKIDRSLGLIQNNSGVEAMRQRELINYLVRTSQRQQ
jgi:hypothetical protein